MIVAERKDPLVKKKNVPEFRTEDGERKFWAKHDSSGLIDWRTAERRRFPNLKPTLRTISLAERLEKEIRRT